MQDWSKYIERPIVDDVFENGESYQESEKNYINLAMYRES